VFSRSSSIHLSCVWWTFHRQRWWLVGGYTQDDGIDIKVVIDSVVDLFRPNNRRPVVIGLGLCMLAAFSGSNTIIYYASCVFEELGLQGDNLLTWAVAIPNIAGALIALVRRLRETQPGGKSVEPTPTQNFRCTDECVAVRRACSHVSGGHCDAQCGLLPVVVQIVSH
jgi:hypothetical protein